MGAYHHGSVPPRHLRAFNALLVFLFLSSCVLVGTAFRPAQAATGGDLLGNIPVVDENTLNNAACGVAAATMVLDYYLLQQDPNAQPVDISIVAEYVQENYYFDSKRGKKVFTGTTFDQLQTGLEAASTAPDVQLGDLLKSAWHTTDQTHWFSVLTTEIDAKRPVVLFLADGGTLGWTWHYGHFIVVSGYTSDESIIYHDPWDGKAHTLSKTAFATAWGTTWNGNSPWMYMQVIPSTPISQPTPTPPLSQQSIYVGGQDGTIYALNASNGTQRWKYPTSSQYAPAPQVVDGVVYFILDDANTQSSTLYALNAVDGTLRKTYTLPYYAFNGDPYIPSYAVANGVIYVSGVDMAFALNSNNGSRLWQYPWNGLGASAPLVVNNLMFAVTYQADVYAFNSANGTLSWKYSLGPDAEPPGALSGRFATPVMLNNTLYVLGWSTNNVYAINVATHTLVWHAQLANAGVSALYVANGSIYVDAHSYPSESVYALQAATGAQLWRKNNLSLRFADSTALYCAGIGADGSLSGVFFALHFDGTTMWQIHLGNTGSYGLWTTAVQTIVYISTETALYAFRITDGSLLWQIPISGDVVAP